MTGTHTAGRHATPELRYSAVRQHQRHCRRPEHGARSRACGRTRPRDAAATQGERGGAAPCPPHRQECRRSPWQRRQPRERSPQSRIPRHKPIITHSGEAAVVYFRAPRYSGDGARPAGLAAALFARTSSESVTSQVQPRYHD